MGTYEFKKFSYYLPQPKAIHCLAFSSSLSKVALTRSDNTVELWDVKHTPHLDRVFMKEDEESIESVAWCGERLFISGMTGSVIELDLLNLSIKHEIAVTSGSCWCIDICKKNMLIAAGTEDGFINIINIYDDSIVFQKLLDKQEGRVLCIAWEKTGQFLATGSVDAVRVWNLNTGHAIHKLTPSRVEMNKPTVIWCLTITTDFTIITGDSRGRLTFWDGNKGLQLDTHQSHKADILSICLNREETKLYCAGVDPLIASFEKVNVRRTGTSSVADYKWVKSIQRVIHDHDVRALTMCDDKLFSGGVDCYLASSSYPPKVLIKYSQMLQSRRLCLAYEARILLVSYYEHLELWHWSNQSTLNHIAMIKSYKNKGIRCSSISPDASWVVYSSESILRLLRFSIIKDTTKTEIKRVTGVPGRLRSGAVCLCFSEDSKYLAVADKSRHINVVELRPDESVHMVDVLNNIENEYLHDVIHLMCVTKSCEYIVVADRSSNIAVWKEFQYHCSLPKYHCAPTAMAVSSDQKYVVVSYADHKIVEFNLSKKRYTSFSRKLDHNLPKQWSNRQFPVEGIVYDKQNSDVIIIYDDTTICFIDKTKKLPEKNCKIPRLDAVKSPDSSDTSESSNSQFSLSRGDNIAFHVLKEFKHLVYLNIFSENELLAVEVNPDTFMKKLPPGLPKKRYGVM